MCTRLQACAANEDVAETGMGFPHINYTHVLKPQPTLQVSQFCDSGKGSRQQNRFAPNKHNVMCKGKSTWEVISENEDFKKYGHFSFSSKPNIMFKLAYSFSGTTLHNCNGPMTRH
ncbi:hypothetical protein MRX96_052608 [Rhipicephalus microplus]